MEFNRVICEMTEIRGEWYDLAYETHGGLQ